MLPYIQTQVFKYLPLSLSLSMAEQTFSGGQDVYQGILILIKNLMFIATDKHLRNEELPRMEFWTLASHIVLNKC